MFPSAETRRTPPPYVAAAFAGKLRDGTNEDMRIQMDEDKKQILLLEKHKDSARIDQESKRTR